MNGLEKSTEITESKHLEEIILKKGGGRKKEKRKASGTCRKLTKI